MQLVLLRRAAQRLAGPILAAQGNTPNACSTNSSKPHAEGCQIQLVLLRRAAQRLAGPILAAQGNTPNACPTNSTTFLCCTRKCKRLLYRPQACMVRIHVQLVLLKDAVKQLDDPFLVVVVGEFNSGKSSVINSLLGKKFLAEGILPTTNEISILKYSDEEGAETRVEQQADGLYVKSFPSKLLEEMHIVDTPGTNVILERQQRLTEEYVPRADLVLFVMSVDRAFSESEVRFLDYIRQWRKKVVFVINKADMLTSPQEVEQVKSFVSNNAARVLKLDHPPVIAVSSRSAMRAKEAAMKGDPSGSGLSCDSALLAQNPDWESSGFAAFERLIYNFLVGTSSQHQGSAQDPVLSGTGEGVRLKLQTPLFVADALIGAAGQRLQAELSAVKAELAAVRMVSQQLARFRVDMEKDALAQRQLLQKVLSTATSRTDAFIDRTLALSNASQLAAYITGGKAKENLTGKSLEKFEAEAVGTSFERLKEAVEEHSRWLVTNCEAQLSYYQSFVQQRIQEAEASGRPLPQRASAAPSAILSAASSNVLQIGGLNPPPKPAASAASPAAQGQLQLTGDDEALSTNPATMSQAAAAADDYVQQLTLARQKGLGSAALVWKTVEGFDMRAAVTLLDEEIREAVLGTATTAVGAPAAGLVATSIISNTLEDFLVMGMASLAAYASVLNLPLRRAEIKGKVAKLAGNFVEAVQGRMQAQVNEAVDFSVKAIETAVTPLEEVSAEEVARLEAMEAQRLVLIDAVRELQRRVANLE
ncbi:hypothetical protein DUNSADRAFT_16642 [Dunaliella salina]|uniref:G domain-containing protein n=1 Tax=Dunaliella salina TaxID=3046 RepID=A0ABQ7G368_DUNSA|nr:hypothetical protein DUNSADRAFT_16642 [Dunaliella salina]|eukprot:KAF5829049.1 hypothetical protein DUNSADRAFT_16642 [Dunaliella salina]